METYITFITRFVKVCLKIATPSQGYELDFVTKSSSDPYEKYTSKTIHIILCILIHSSFCVFNFMLSAYRPNSFEVAYATNKVD
jgi:hypothetical protein